MSLAARVEGQSLISPRAIAIGAFSPLVSDSRGFVANPTGMLGTRDWEFGAVTYLPTSGESNGFVFHGLTISKKFLEQNAFAMQFSDGSSLEFTVPGAATIGSEPTSVDSRVTYSERFSLGYGYKASSELSMGTNLRFRQEQITDTQYQLMDTLIVRLPDAVYDANSWAIDLALDWKPIPEVSATLLGINLVTSTTGGFPTSFQQYRLDLNAAIDLGLAYRASPSLVAAIEGNTQGAGAVGAEWSSRDRLSLRGGFYMSDQEIPFVYALGMGLGWSYEFLEFDMSYLHFLNSDTHSGSVNTADFNASSITNLDLNPYTQPRLSLSITASFGHIRESLARIDRVDLAGEIYPASHAVLAYSPLGKAIVTNVSTKPIQARASFFVDDFMDSPTESQPVPVNPGEQVEIPLTAVFNDQLDNAKKAEVHDATVVVSASSDETADDRVQTRVLIHGRNDWDGTVELLRYFVTPEDPSVIRYTRDVLLNSKDSLSGAQPELDLFQKAKVLFDTFAGKLVYVNDPKQTSDYVQYPAETMRLHGGDCDDMTVCFSSLLNSIGISTAFVDVIPPDDPENSHIYLLFDTGVRPQNGTLIAENPKRYVVRRNSRGEESIWIPMETTVITKGFGEAWNTGAEELFNDVEVNLGQVKGWVRIVDVN